MHYIACNSRCHVHVEHTYSYFVNIWLICTWHLVCKRNPRSGERSDEYIEGLYYGSHISIHAPANGATAQRHDEQTRLLFQSTLRRTERRSRECLCTVGQEFQSTLRRTERQDIHSPYSCIHYFNPRSGERGDLTTYHQRMRYIQFQSTLRRTERQHRRGRLGHTTHFNPRSGERSDNLSVLDSARLVISIHAPTNGATP